MTDQAAADIYIKCGDPVEAARSIKAEALKRGTTDNVSVMCIQLHPLRT
jgi:serine/threonine protein phosphatase PrpC